MMYEKSRFAEKFNGGGSLHYNKILQSVKGQVTGLLLDNFSVCLK